MPLDVERLLQRAPQPLGHADRIAGVGDVVEEDGELVAGESRQREAGLLWRHGIGAAQARLQALRHGDEQAIGGQRPQAVADHPEPIEPEHEQRKRHSPGAVRCA